MFEKDRKVILDHPNASGIGNAYLPVTKNHDVLALFGSSSKDYSEVDLGDLTDPFNMLFLPMNELVFQNGLYDLTRTPDLSGFFSDGPTCWVGNHFDQQQKRLSSIRIIVGASCKRSCLAS